MNKTSKLTFNAPISSFSYPHKYIYIYLHIISLAESLMNSQGINSAAHSATLKGKINALEETIRGMNEELNFYKKEIQTLRSEKETLEDVLSRKAGDIRKSLASEVARYIYTYIYIHNNGMLIIGLRMR